MLWIKKLPFDEKSAIAEVYNSTLTEAVKHLIWKTTEKVSSALDAIEHYEGTRNNISKIWEYIRKQVWEITKMTSKKRITQIDKEKIYFFWYVQWIIKKFRNVGFDNFQAFQAKEIPANLRTGIFNILKDDALTSFFLVSKFFWILDTTDKNPDEKEREMKVLNCSRNEVADGLNNWKEKWKWLTSAEEVWEFEIEDEYYDDKYLRLDRKKIVEISKKTWKEEKSKRSVRVRKKINLATSEEVHYYTLKRTLDEKEQKDTKNTSGETKEAREAFEGEYAILNPDIFKKVLPEVWLRVSRRKKKVRKTYNISFMFEEKEVQAVIDIDNYGWKIPELIEVECNIKDKKVANRAIQHIIQELWFGDKEQMTDGSRGLFEKYEEEYDKDYLVDNYGNITWYQPWTKIPTGEYVNINDAPTLEKAA